jgi:uncharacterized protein (TIGR03067 family)
LPEKYRAPVVLCYFEGKTNEQAAEELGCPKSSLSTRLGRARELLRERLVRRGITLSAGTLAAVLLGQTAAAGSPALLVISTVKAAVGFAPVPAAVVALTQGAMKTMFPTKLKIVAVVVAGLLAGGAVLAAHHALAEADRAGAPTHAGPARENPPPAKNAPPTPAADELEALQGAWECESADLEGKALPDDEVKKMRVVIEGDQMVIVPGGEFERMSIKVDAAKNPKVLHVTPTEGKDKGKTTPVIYDLDPKAGTLRLCFDTKEGKKLPTEFAAKPGSGMVLLTLKREVPPLKAPPQEKPDRKGDDKRPAIGVNGVGVAPGEEKAAARDKEWAKFEGSWQFSAGENGGNPMNPADLPVDTLTWGKAGKWEQTCGATVVEKGTAEIDPTAQPKALDWTANANHFAIYEFVDADTLRVCTATRGNARPRDFSTRRGDGRYVFVLKRVRAK